MQKRVSEIQIEGRELRLGLNDSLHEFDKFGVADPSEHRTSNTFQHSWSDKVFKSTVVF